MADALANEGTAGAGHDDDGPLLEVRDLVTHYPVRRKLGDIVRGREQLRVRAVDGVSFEVGHGEMVALVGESGCGKTTTAQSVMRLADPRDGVVELSGQDITHLSHRELRPIRRRMQLVYQDPYGSLDPRFRVRRTVAEPLRVHGIGASAAERERLVVEAMELCGLTPAELYLDRFPHELSGGQRQRVAIAAGIVLAPQLLVADEPVSMLDVSVRAEILRLLAELRGRGLGILMITHDLSVASNFADRVYVMYMGRIVEQGPAREVVRRPSHPYTRALISVVPTRDPTVPFEPQILTGEIPDAVHVPPGCRFHPRCPVAIDACRATDPELKPIRRDQSTAVACIRVGPDGELENGVSR